MPPSIVRRKDRGHVLLTDGWVARAPAPISAPCDPPRHSLRYNGFDEIVMQAVRVIRDPAGMLLLVPCCASRRPKKSGVSITFY